MIKKLFYGIIAASMLMACNSNSNQKNDSSTVKSATADAPIMQFDKENFDFGKIKEGEKVTHDFKFTNTGKTPLIIQNAQATCGCTIPQWKHSPIQPGESSSIQVTFNSAGKHGLQDKQIVVTANTNPVQNIVHLVGEVLEK